MGTYPPLSLCSYITCPILSLQSQSPVCHGPQSSSVRGPPRRCPWAPSSFPLRPMWATQCREWTYHLGTVNLVIVWMWLKQCHKPPIWEWFIPPVKMVMTGGLFIGYTTLGQGWFNTAVWDMGDLVHISYEWGLKPPKSWDWAERKIEVLNWSN